MTVSKCAHTLALGQSFPRQAVAQLSLYAHGDFGTTNLGHPVLSDLRSAVPATALLWLCMLAVVSAAVGPLQRFRLAKVGSRLAAFVGVLELLPGIWLGLMLVFLVSYQWKLLPATHAQSINVPAAGSRSWLHQLFQHPPSVLADMVRHFALPVTVLAFMVVPPHARHARHLQNEVGLKPLTARVVAIARSLPILIGASTAVETLFQLNGVGYLFVRSLHGEDYATSLAVFMLASLLTLTAGFFASAIQIRRSVETSQKVAPAHGG